MTGIFPHCLPLSASHHLILPSEYLCLSIFPQILFSQSGDTVFLYTPPPCNPPTLRTLAFWEMGASALEHMPYVCVSCQAVTTGY